MIQTFHQGLGQVSGPVTWLQEGYAVKPDDLIKYSGYKTDRAAEIKDARALWAAGGGPALGEVDIKIPDTWLGPWPDTTQIIPKMLNDNLGVTQFKSTKTTYNEEIIPNLSNGKFPNWFAWTSQVNSPDPRTDLFNTYNSKSPTNFQHVNNPDIDKLTVDALNTTDYNTGRSKALEVQDILLKNGMFGNVVLYNYISRGAYWNYVHPNLKTYPTASTPGAGYNIFSGYLTGQQAWLDLKAPSATGRPAKTV
jgi:ABC-type oligopeptide transport system substrate-binding subunit